MTPRQYWNSYVKKLGRPARVAEHLGIPFPTIAAVCNGRRGIGRSLATRMAAADPSLDESVLVWVEAIPHAVGVLASKPAKKSAKKAPKKKGARRAA